MRKYLAIISLLLCSTLYAQRNTVTVSGYITDSSSGETLIGAGVLLVVLATNLGKKTPLWDRLSSRPVLAVSLSACILLLVLIFGSYGVGYDAADFIYGQF